MKLFSSVLLSFALLLTSVISQTSEESPELKEATALTESVVKLYNERKFDEALPLAKRALEIREGLLPRNDPRVSVSLSYLADVYKARRDYGAAKSTLQRLLQVQEERSGPNDVSLARTLERLGLLHLSDAEDAKAEERFKQALQIKEKALKADDVQIADTLVGLGTVYRARSDFDRGAPLFKRALTIYAQRAGVNSPAFQQTGAGFSCLAYETLHREAIKDLDEIWKRFAPAGSPAESPYTTMNGKALSLPKPAYPDHARLRRISGVVVVKVVIDENGRVINAYDLCQGSPYLMPGALESARNARFEPPRISGQPVQLEGTITYRFVAQ